LKSAIGSRPRLGVRTSYPAPVVDRLQRPQVDRIQRPQVDRLQRRRSIAYHDGRRLIAALQAGRVPRLGGAGAEFFSRRAARPS